MRETAPVIWEGNAQRIAYFSLLLQLALMFNSHSLSLSIIGNITQPTFDARDQIQTCDSLGSIADRLKRNVLAGTQEECGHTEQSSGLHNWPYFPCWGILHATMERIQVTILRLWQNANNKPRNVFHAEWMLVLK